MDWSQAAAAIELLINSTLTGEALLVPRGGGHNVCEAIEFLWKQGLLKEWKIYEGGWVAGVLQGVVEEVESVRECGVAMMRLDASELVWACWNQYLADCLRGPDLRMEKVEWNHRCGRFGRYTEKNGSCDVVVDFAKAKLISDAGKKLDGQKSAWLARPEVCSCCWICH